MALRILIGGAMGRMGHELTAACERGGVVVAGGVDVAYAGQAFPFPVFASYEQAAQVDANVLIDFSRPESLPDLLALCLQKSLPAVLCATGYTEDELSKIKTAAQSSPILRSANMSLGMNVLEQLARMASRVLGDGYDIEIIEKHHRMKADSPSGTALMLYEAVKSPVSEPVYGRYGRTQRRQKAEIGLHAVRGGTVTGEHEVGFYGEGEQIILTHRAENRSLFAEGALTAARFLQGKPAGLYAMRDVVAEMLEV